MKGTTLVLLVSAIEPDGYVAMSTITSTREEILRLTPEEFAVRILVPMVAIIKDKLK